MRRGVEYETTARLLFTTGLILALASAALAGCRAPSPPDTSAGGSGNQGAGPGNHETPLLEPFPPFDWDAAVAQLPSPGFGHECKEFKAFNDAVGELLTQAYVIDRTWLDHSLVLPTAYPEEQENRYQYTWSVFLDGNRLLDPLEYADTLVQLALTVSPSFGEYRDYAPAYDVSVDEAVKWDYDAHDPLEAPQARVLEVQSRILHLVCGKYLPVGDAFWTGFEVVHSLALEGVLRGGVYDLPGTHGGNVQLGMGWMEARRLKDVYDLKFSFRVLPPPADQGPAPAADWSSLVAQLPEPGFGEPFNPFEKATLDAFGRFWSSEPRVCVNRVVGDVSPGWWHTGFSWFRVPKPAEPDDFLYESLSVRLLPAPSADSPALAQSAEVTELVAGIGGLRRCHARRPGRPLSRYGNSLWVRICPWMIRSRASLTGLS